MKQKSSVYVKENFRPEVIETIQSLEKVSSQLDEMKRMIT